MKKGCTVIPGGEVTGGQYTRRLGTNEDLGVSLRVRRGMTMKRMKPAENTQWGEALKESMESLTAVGYTGRDTNFTVLREILAS